MRRVMASVVSLKEAASIVGYSDKTLRNRANEGFYPSTVIGKVRGKWVVDLEEWNRWHRQELANFQQA